MHWLVIVASVAVAACHPSPAPGRHVVEYRGGQWYDGHAFSPREMWVVDDRFATTQPGRVDEVIDLDGGFVVPPYAEGHNHWLEPNLVETYVQVYLRDGIFYVKDQGTAPAFHERMRSKLGGPSSVDYISAHQGFTGPNGHPIELVDQLVKFGILPSEWGPTHGEGEALFVVTSEADIDRAFPRLLAGHPDFVKVFLVHSDEFAARRDNATLTPHDRGIDPALVPAIVKRAHAANLRVSAHIENAHDFHVAISAGVDDIAHMPFVGSDNLESYRIADADLTAAAARNVSIATTFDWMNEAKDDPKRIDIERDNLTRMRRAGNLIVIGTDLFRTTATAEVDLIVALKLMTNAELLHAWCEATPRAIFPNRHLGRLEDGAEASFLVLGGDPLVDFAQTHHILMRVKLGHRIEATQVTMPRLGG